MVFSWQKISLCAFLTSTCLACNPQNQYATESYKYYKNVSGECIQVTTLIDDKGNILSSSEEIASAYMCSP